MTYSTSQIRTRALQRPYWLLLALALFIGGQIAAAGHWHDVAKTVDSDCALCVLSSATSGAITASAWQAPVITLFIAVFFYVSTSSLRGVSRFHDSRAPPFNS